MRQTYAYDTETVKVQTVIIPQKEASFRVSQYDNLVKENNVGIVALHSIKSYQRSYRNTV